MPVIGTWEVDDEFETLDRFETLGSILLSFLPPTTIVSNSSKFLDWLLSFLERRWPGGWGNADSEDDCPDASRVLCKLDKLLLPSPRVLFGVLFVLELMAFVTGSIMMLTFLVSAMSDGGIASCPESAGARCGSFLRKGRVEFR